MKLPGFDPRSTNVEDQRAPEVRNKMDFLLRYMAALANRKRQDGSIFQEEEWEPHQNDAYNTLYPPSIYKPPREDFQLAPDIGKLRDHRWDDYLMNFNRKN